MPKRTAASASLGLLGLAVLSGCASTPGPLQVELPEEVTSSGSPAGGAYTDGTYTAEGEYINPGGVEKIEVTVEIADDKIVDVQFSGDPKRAESKNFQGQFADGLAAEVVGKPLDEVRVDRIAGSSLTGGGFNDALEKIKKAAAES